MVDTLKAWVAGSVVMLALGFVWYELLMAAQYEVWEAGLPREAPLDGAMLAGLLLITLTMAYMYPQGYSGGSHVKEGLRFGALIGLIWVGVTLVFYGYLPVPWVWAVSESLANLVLYIATGGAIGYAYGLAAQPAKAPAAP